MLRYAVFFLLGLIREAGVTLYYRYVSRRRVYGATATSAGISLMDVIVFVYVAGYRDIPGGIAYALGEGLGTFLVLKLSR